MKLANSIFLQNFHVKKPANEFKKHYNFFETQIFIAPLSTNIGLIHKGISETKL